MLVEVLIGAGIVLLEYVDQNKSVARAIWMAVHLMNTFMLVGAMTLAAHFDWTLPFGPPPLWHFVIFAVVAAPLVEEAIFRFALCSGAENLLGPRTTIVLSGLAFAAMHYVVDNPGPDNFIAGYVLAWAYLKSRSILVPIILHALGNLSIYVILVAFDAVL